MKNEDYKYSRLNDKEEGNLYFLALLIGMFLGLFIGGIVFYNLDKTKWPNPYGWWYPATFISTVGGAILGLLVYNKYKKQ